MTFEPTCTQREILECTASSILISAPAGCGKTEAIALRVQGLIEREQVSSPRQILALTYSNRATENLRERCAARLRTRSANQRLVVQNFHGFSMRVLLAHSSVIGLDGWPLTYPPGDLVGKWLDERGFSNKFGARDDIYDELRSTKQQLFSDEEVLAALRQPLAREFEQWRQANHVLTYDDVVRYADLLLSNSGVANLYQERFPFVMLDEFQDTTLQQLRIATQVAPDGVTFAGDIGQWIYRFTGADPEGVLAIARQRSEFEFSLNESHRSSPAVLSAYNALSRVAESQELSCAHPDRWPSGGIAVAASFDTWDEEAEWVEGICRSILANSPSSRIGILAPSANRRRRLDEIFEASPVTSFRWDAPLHDPAAAPMLRRLLSLLDSQGVHHAIYSADELRSLIGDPGLHDADAAKSFEAGLSWISSELIDATPKDLLKKFREGKPERLLQEPGVHQLTGHTGKGLQFDWVFIAGLEEGNLPFYNTTTHAAIRDQARVLSVMITRARFGVFFCCSGMYFSARDREMRQPRSRYADDLGPLSPRRNLESWFASVDWNQINSSL